MNKSNTAVLAPFQGRSRGPIIEMEQGFVIPTREQLLRASERNPAHFHAKRVDPKLVETSANNKPFGDHAGFIINSDGIDSKKIVDAVERFLLGTYGNLKDCGVSFSLLETDVKKEAAAVEEYSQRFKKLGFTNQENSVLEHYKSFKGLKDCLRIMHEQGTLRPESFLPIEFLPEVFIAAPVWFGGQNKSVEVNYRQYICNQFPNQDGADLFQMYNLNNRNIKSFSGKDIIPTNILSIIPAAEQAFDYVAIATPYHDLASDVWEDMRWQRNIDPFLLGFMTGVPIIFMLGRWSGSGIFPLFLEMVADTMDHLRTNINLLDNFQSDDWFEKVGQNEDGSKEGGDLLKLTNRILGAHAKGELFNVLRTQAS